MVLYLKIPDSLNLIDSECCQECGGRCCKHCGCVYSPDDFENLSYSYLRNLLEKENISVVSQFIGDRRHTSYFLYLRARNLGRDTIDLFSLKTVCASLTETGCAYPKEKRPQGGLLYIPKKNHQCYMLYDGRTGYEEWIQHQKVLERLVQYFSGQPALEKLKSDIVQVTYQLATKNGNNEIILSELTDEEKTIWKSLNFILPTFEAEVTEGLTLAKRKNMK